MSDSRTPLARVPLSRVPLRVREMTLADCPRVAEIRVRGWQSAYRGLMPQSYLDGLDVSAELPRRRAHFEQGLRVW